MMKVLARLVFLLRKAALDAQTLLVWSVVMMAGSMATHIIKTHRKRAQDAVKFFKAVKNATLRQNALNARVATPLVTRNVFSVLQIVKNVK